MDSAQFATRLLHGSRRCRPVPGPGLRAGPRRPYRCAFAYTTGMEQLEAAVKKKNSRIGGFLGGLRH